MTNTDLKTRLKMAWNAFNLKPFEICFESYKERGGVSQSQCDCSWDSKNNICHSGKRAISCYSTAEAKFEVTYDQDHIHCCEDCAKHFDDNDKEWMRSADLIV